MNSHRDHPAEGRVVQVAAAGAVLKRGHGQWGVATAAFDIHRIYRYSLSREWDPAATRVLWIMLNPSTATARKVDPTINRVLRFSKDWGHGSVEVINLFALRVTDPSQLQAHQDPVGPLNDQVIEEAIVRADRIMAAWGTQGTLHDRNTEIAQLLVSLEAEASVLGLTKEGHPRHPLYLPGFAKPFDWIPPGSSTPRRPVQG